MFLSVVQCFKGIQLCAGYNNIRVESQGNTAGKNYLHKISSQIFLCVALLACETDRHSFQRRRKEVLPGLGLVKQ